jgi:hypothetical protein
MPPRKPHDHDHQHDHHHDRRHGEGKAGPGGSHRALDAVLDAADRGRISQGLAPWLPDAGDRDFLLRCMLNEGPQHHRASNAVLLRLLVDVAALVGPAPVDTGPGVPVRMRLPPHLLEHNADARFPLEIPVNALARLAPTGSDAQRAMADLLGDGPPQHALANAAMVTLLHHVLRALEDRA